MFRIASELGAHQKQDIDRASAPWIARAQLLDVFFRGWEAVVIAWVRCMNLYCVSLKLIAMD